VGRLTQAVAEKLLELGADLVGFAPVERFANAPEGHRPTDFMPECKTVISIAVHLFQGMAEVWGEYDKAGKTITPYLFYGFGLANLESSRIVNTMAKLLEYEGYRTLCFLPTWPASDYKYFEQTAVTNKLKAEFSHRHAAAAAGIGELGWSGMVLTPEFGSMQRLNSILTSAELEPTTLYDGPTLCRPEKCGMKCVEVCPVGALSLSETQSFVIDGKKTTYSTHDAIRCQYAVRGLVKGSGGRTRVQIPDGPGKASEMAAVLQRHEINPYDQKMQANSPGIICGNFCGKCLHQCPSKKLIRADVQKANLCGRYAATTRSRLLS
jgi:epoxyqueuosine reductase